MALTFDEWWKHRNHLPPGPEECTARMLSRDAWSAGRSVDDLSPEGSPRRATALVLRLHGDTDHAVANRLRELADAFDGRPYEASAADGSHLTAGFDSSYTLRVERRTISREDFQAELSGWIQTHPTGGRSS